MMASDGHNDNNDSVVHGTDVTMKIMMIMTLVVMVIDTDDDDNASMNTVTTGNISSYIPGLCSLSYPVLCYNQWLIQMMPEILR